jgi:di/tricarboxylate transporter
MYRFLLMVVKRSPPSYLWKTFVVPLAGVTLTPVLPCPGSRAVMAAPVLTDLSEILGFQRDSPGAVGLGMASLLGFVNMSFLFLNGAADCLLALGLLPAAARASITWSSWLHAALPLGLVVFLGSYLAVIGLHNPKKRVAVDKQVIEAQLRTLGPLTRHERVSLIVVMTCLMGFIGQPWVHIDGAWVAMLCFLILFATSVLTEKSICSDIDWIYVISFGAAVSFAEVISASGLSPIVAGTLKPYMEVFLGNTLVFLLALSLVVTLLRFVLPLPATLVVIILSITPLAYTLDVHPFVIALVTLASANPWVFPYQNIFFCLMLEATDGKIFTHKHTVRMAFAHIVIVLAAVAVSVPHWRALGLIR